MRRSAAGLGLAIALAGCGGAPAIDEALRDRLEERALSVRSVSCIDSGLRYEGARVFRCNINFGDPHVVPYCAALVDGSLATDREHADMRCYRPEDEQRYRDAAFGGR